MAQYPDIRAMARALNMKWTGESIEQSYLFFGNLSEFKDPYKRFKSVATDGTSVTFFSIISNLSSFMIISCLLCFPTAVLPGKALRVFICLQNPFALVSDRMVVHG